MSFAVSLFASARVYSIRVGNEAEPQPAQRRPRREVRPLMSFLINLCLVPLRKTEAVNLSGVFYEEFESFFWDFMCVPTTSSESETKQSKPQVAASESSV